MTVTVKFNTDDALANLAFNQTRHLILETSTAYGDAIAEAVLAAAGNTGDGAITRKFTYALNDGFTITTKDSVGGTNINAVDLDLAAAVAATPAAVAADLQVKIRAAAGATGTEVVEWNSTEERFEISDADLGSVEFAAPVAGLDVTEQLGFKTAVMDAVNNKVYGFPIGPAQCGSATKSETWTFECTAAAGDSGTFTVTGSLSGEQAAKLTVGTGYSSAGSEIYDVHIADGAVDWAVGDIVTMITHASKINVLTPLTSLADFKSPFKGFGEIKSGPVLSLNNATFNADDYAQAMFIAALGSKIPLAYILSAKAHGYARSTEPSNAEYDAANLKLKEFSIPKVMIHESLTQADQIDLAQLAFDECGPTNMRPSFALFGFGINGTQTNYTDRAKAIDDGVTRGTNTSGMTPYALIAPGDEGALDENGVLHATIQRAIAVSVGVMRCLEPDPAMPLHEELELGGFGGLQGPWDPAEHSALNAAGVTTLKSKGGARIVIHQFRTCVNLQSNGPKIYSSWTHESVVWSSLYIMEVLRDLYSQSPYGRTKHTEEVRVNMRLDGLAELRKAEKVEWSTSRGAGVIQNVDDYAASFTVERSDTSAVKAEVRAVISPVSPLIDTDVTISLIL